MRPGSARTNGFRTVFGLLDDVILVPLGIALCIRMIPAEVYAQARRKVVDAERRPANRVAGAVPVVIWLGAAIACAVWLTGRAA